MVQPVRSPSAPAAAAASSAPQAKAAYTSTSLLNGASRQQPQDLGAPPEVSILGPDLPQPFRTLRDQIPAAAAALEQRILNAESTAAAAAGQVTPVHVPSQADVHVAGRVCSGDGGRLTPANLALEGSRTSSAGCRVKLDCSLLQNASLFPGQALAVHGRNPTGQCVTAHAVLPPAPTAPTENASGPEGVEPAAASGGPEGPLVRDAAAGGPRGAVRLVVAAGPYTRGDTLEFVALEALMQYCREQRPGALLLLGPFVPDAHPALLGLQVTFKALFQQQVLKPLQALAAAVPGLQVLLQPAVGDAHHLPVHPQPPFPTPVPASGVRMLPSPAHVRIGDCVLTVSSAPILMDLAGAEISTQAGPRDRMRQFFEHVLDQGNLYPLFPPSAAACVDWSHAEHLALPQRPHLLLLPSMLPACAKVVCTPGAGKRSTVCVNLGVAGRQTKGEFVDVTVGKASASESESRPWEAKDCIGVNAVSWSSV